MTEIFSAGDKVKVNGNIYKVLESPKNVNAANFAAFYKLLNTWTKDTILVHAKHVQKFNQYEINKNFYDILK
jgi:uncharacterized hydantoinase/oxoprolinase family protein